MRQVIETTVGNYVILQPDEWSGTGYKCWQASFDPFRPIALDVTILHEDEVQAVLEAERLAEWSKFWELRPSGLKLEIPWLEVEELRKIQEFSDSWPQFGPDEWYVVHNSRLRRIAESSGNIMEYLEKTDYPDYYLAAARNLIEAGFYGPEAARRLR